jgi:hypothetical protein
MPTVASNKVVVFGEEMPTVASNKVVAPTLLWLQLLLSVSMAGIPVGTLWLCTCAFAHHAH